MIGEVVPSHTLKRGDCLSLLGEKYGFFWQTIWAHEKNQQLRQIRANPNVLEPGDVVFIPDIRLRSESCATGCVHEFRLKGVPARFVLYLRDSDGSPPVGLQWKLQVTGGETYTGTTEGDALISKVIPPDCPSIKLTVSTPDGDEEYDFDLGCLQPVDTVEGIKARLLNLGFFSGEPDSNLDDQTKTAISHFQLSRGLPASGELDDTTRAALSQAHVS
jgi:N-acetylmuramoyl-L-alanine amidase